MTGKVRKPSWEISDLGWKIRTSSLASKTLLAFLGSRSNDRGESWHAYNSIRKHTGLSRDSIHRSARYLRDELKILRWEQGGGRSSNHYQLDLESMRKLVEAQANKEQVSDSRMGTRPMVGHLKNPTVGLHLSDGAEQVSDSRTAPVRWCGVSVRQSDTNPHVTPIEPSKTTLMEPGPWPVFSRECSTSRNEDSGQSAQHSEDRGRATSSEHTCSGMLPQAPSPEVVRGTASLFPWWGESLPGCEFIDGENSGYRCIATGKRLSFEELLQRVAQTQKGERQ